MSRSKRLVCVVRFPVTVAVSFQIPAPTGPIDDPRLPVLGCISVSLPRGGPRTRTRMNLFRPIAPAPIREN